MRNLAASLFAELERTLENRKSKPSVFRMFTDCAQFAADHKYVEILQHFDRAILDGQLWQTLVYYGYKVHVISSTRKHKYEDGASTSYETKSKTFTVKLCLPSASYKIPSNANVGGMICTAQTCVTALLAHEFVHILEIVLRNELRFYTGFSKIDKENIVFTQWLKILFAQLHDRNVI